MRCRPSTEHNFLIESIKALHVYSRIIIIVNKLMQPSRSHGINVNKESYNGSREKECGRQSQDKEITTVISHGDFPYLDKTSGISKKMVNVAVK